MNVFIDNMTPCRTNRKWRWRESCHLFADDISELHSFATSIGVKREWYQPYPILPHYDLTRKRRDIAIRSGAEPVGASNLVAMMTAANLGDPHTLHPLSQYEGVAGKGFKVNVLARTEQEAKVLASRQAVASGVGSEASSPIISGLRMTRYDIERHYQTSFREPSRPKSRG